MYVCKLRYISLAVIIEITVLVWVYVVCVECVECVIKLATTSSVMVFTLCRFSYCPSQLGFHIWVFDNMLLWQPLHLVTECGTKSYSYKTVACWLRVTL